MAVTFTASGTTGLVTQGSTGSPSPGLPATPQDGDVFLLWVVSRDNVAHSVTAGWTQKFQANNGASTRVSLWYARYKATAPDSGQGQVNAAPTITHSGTGACASRIAGFRGCVATGDPVDVMSANLSATGTSISTAGVTPTIDTGLVVHFFGAGTANTANALSAAAGITTACLAATNTASNTGGRACLGAYYRASTLKDVATGTASLTCSAAPATTTGWAAIQVVLKSTLGANEVHVRQDLQGATVTASATTIAATYANPVLAGSTLVAHIGYYSAPQAITCSDSVNGSWTVLSNIADSSAGYSVASIAFQNSGSGTPAVTVTFPTSVSYRAIEIIEVANAATSGSIWYGGQNQANPTTSADAQTSGNVSISEGNRLVLGLSSDPNANAASAVGTGFTIVGATWNTGGNGSVTEQKRITSGTTTAATYTSANTGAHVTLCTVIAEIGTVLTQNLTASASGSPTLTRLRNYAGALTSSAAVAAATIARVSAHYQNLTTSVSTAPNLSKFASRVRALTATSGAPPATPSLGVHVQAFKVFDTAGTTCVTATRVTQASGSTVVCAAGIYSLSTESSAPTDTYSNTYSSVGGATSYPSLSTSGVRIWANTSVSGGTGHSWTKTVNDRSESTISAVEIVGANHIQAYSTTQVSASTTTYTSATVTAVRDSVLLCWLHTEGWTDGPSSAAGWTLIEEYQAGGSSIHQALFARTVSAGDYSCTVTTNASAFPGVISIVVVDNDSTSGGNLAIITAGKSRNLTTSATQSTPGFVRAPRLNQTATGTATAPTPIGPGGNQTKALLGSASAAASATKLVSMVRTGAVSAASLVQRRVDLTRLLTSNAAPTLDHIAAFYRSLESSTLGGGSLLRAGLRNISASTTGGPSFARQVSRGRPLSAAALTSASVSQLKSFVRQLSPTTVGTPTFLALRSLKREQIAASAGAASRVSVVSKPLSSAASWAASITRVGARYRNLSTLSNMAPSMAGEKSLVRLFNAGSSGAPALIFSGDRLRDFVTGAVGSPTVTRIIGLRRSLTSSASGSFTRIGQLPFFASQSGAPGIEQIHAFIRNFYVLSSCAPSLARQYFLSLLRASASTPFMGRQVDLVRSASAPGAATLRRLLPQELAVENPAEASMQQDTTRSRILDTTAMAVADVTRLVRKSLSSVQHAFISWVRDILAGPVVSRTFSWGDELRSLAAASGDEIKAQSFTMGDFRL